MCCSNEYHYIPQGFIQFITLIILSNIKENYSCSGLMLVYLTVLVSSVVVTDAGMPYSTSVKCGSY